MEEVVAEVAAAAAAAVASEAASLPPMRWPSEAPEAGRPHAPIPPRRRRRPFAWRCTMWQAWRRPGEQHAPQRRGFRRRLR